MAPDRMRWGAWPRGARASVPSLVRRAVQAGSLDETVCPETCEVEKACRVVRSSPVVADRGGPAAGLVPGAAVLVVGWGAVRCLRRFRFTWLGPAVFGCVL